MLFQDYKTRLHHCLSLTDKITVLQDTWINLFAIIFYWPLKINEETHHALQDLAKDHMFPIEPWCLHGGNEELGAVSVFARVGHAQPPGAIVL